MIPILEQDRQERREEREAFIAALRESRQMAQRTTPADLEYSQAMVADYNRLISMLEAVQ